VKAWAQRVNRVGDSDGGGIGAGDRGKKTLERGAKYHKGCSMGAAWLNIMQRKY